MMMINLKRWQQRGIHNSRAKHLKIVLHEIYVLPIKNYIWNKFIDTKHGWQDYIMIDVEERLDGSGLIEQLVNEQVNDHDDMVNDLD